MSILINREHLLAKLKTIKEELNSLEFLHGYSIQNDPLLRDITPELSTYQLEKQISRYIDIIEAEQKK